MKGNSPFINKISPVVSPSETIYLEGFVSKLMDKNTSLLTRNTTFEHKFHFDRRYKENIHNCSFIMHQ
jgi:hypothetical protein